MGVGKLLIVVGLVLVVAGVVIVAGGRFFGLGRLLGDIVVRRGNFTFYFPLVTSILLSVLLTPAMWFFGRR